MILYMPRKGGDRGILNVYNLQNHEVCSLRDYFLKIKVYMHKAVVVVDKGLTPFFLGKENWRRPVVITTSDRIAVWKSKEPQGRFHRALVGLDVDNAFFSSWSQFRNLYEKIKVLFVQLWFRSPLKEIKYLFKI